MLHKNVDRIQAQSDIRSSYVAMSAQSGDARQQLLDHLKTELGAVIVYDESKLAMARAAEGLDRQGLHDLKNIQFG